MSTLNPQQRAAVTAPDGPALVLAGAGTGKTRVIVERLGWLAEERGVDPRQLLALTFTNKAAAEMKARLGQRLDMDPVPSWLGTFHSFGLFVLRREMEQLGRPKTFTIFDDSDQLSLMKRLIQQLPGNSPKVSPREALGWVSRLKQEVAKPDFTTEPEDETEEAFRKLWNPYHDALVRAAGVDFDDLLVLTARLFQDHEDVLQRYQRRYRYVLIDEYQDTNRAQYVIAKRLSGAHGNLFAVGDEDQGIYSWRGADIRNILEFAKDFPDAMTYRLEENYRSTKQILDAANAVVSNNVNRLGKTLVAVKGTGEPVGFYWAEDSEDEARFVVEDIVKKGVSPREVAVLFRTNAQARQLEEVLRLKGINYIVIGGVKFYARKEIKDILAYLRLLVNPDDDESLRRVINVPARGIGGTTMEQLDQYAQQRHCTLFKVLREVELDETMSARARNAVGQFVHLLDDLALTAKTASLAELVEEMLDRVGYRDYVKQSDEKDFRSRLDIVDEFVVSCKQHDKNNAGTGLLGFLQDLALVSDTDEIDPNAPAVTLMTCHSAKGLEFEHVYLVGMEEGLFPLMRDGEDDYEEERRLCYVAMTRARTRLVLTAAKSRLIYGERRDHRELSRFIYEIGTDRLVRLNPTKGEKLAQGKTSAGAAPQADPDEVRTGTLIRHAKFGPGQVLFTQGKGDKCKARIRFNTGKIVTLMLSQAPVEIIDGTGKKR